LSRNLTDAQTDRLYELQSRIAKEDDLARTTFDHVTAELPGENEWGG